MSIIALRLEPSFSKRPGCPKCGSMNVGTRETIEGHCGLEFDGEDWDFGGSTDVNWDSSISTHLQCRTASCMWELELEQDWTLSDIMVNELLTYIVTPEICSDDECSETATYSLSIPGSNRPRFLCDEGAKLIVRLLGGEVVG